MKKILLLGSLMGLSFLSAQNTYSYGFDTAFAADWTLTNQSSPVTATLWGKATYTTPLTNPLFGSGNTTTVPVGQAGGANSFALVNYTSTSGAGTISNWLITPAISVKDGDVVSFFTRKGTDGVDDYPDRLELRYSTAATTVNPTGATGVGSFTNLGVTVNAALAAGFVYPKTWTKYSFTVAGVGTTPVSVKFGFRYYVTSGGPSGANSDLIGIDTFSIDRPTLAVNDSEVSKKAISVYPNPATDFVAINGSGKVKNIEIFDIAGKKVEAKLDGNKVDVRNLASGVYLINVEIEGKNFTEKFIKK